MDSAGTAPSSLSPRWQRGGVLLAVLAFGLYAWLLVAHVGAYAAGADSSGYLSQARLLAHGEVRIPARVLPGLAHGVGSEFLFAPLGFNPVEGGKELVASYPVGLPLLIAAMAQVTGWDHAAACVLVVHSLAGVWLMFALGRTLGLAIGGAALGAVILAVNPVYFLHSQVTMSDLPATTWVMLAVWLAWRSREHSAWALGAGAAMAVAVLIRPNNALALLPLAIALGFAPRRWLLLAIAGLPGAVFFCLHNRAAFGAALTTGYGSVGGMFEWRWVGPTLLHYLCWFPLLFTPLVLLTPAVGWTLRREPAKALMLCTWALAYLAFYSAYVCTHETWWYLRFVLPAAPALVLGGLLAMQAWTQRWTGTRWGGVILAVAMVAVVANGAAWNRYFHTLSAGQGERAYDTAAKWMRAELPADAVILGMQVSGCLMYHTDLTVVRWDQIDDAAAGKQVLAAAGNRPVYAALFPFETDEVLKLRFPGRWAQVAEFPPIVIWRRDGD